MGNDLLKVNYVYINFKVLNYAVGGGGVMSIFQKFLAFLGIRSAKVAAGAASAWGMKQPKEPENL